MGNRRPIFRFHLKLLPCVQRMFFPITPIRFPRDRGIPRKPGMPFAPRSWVFGLSRGSQLGEDGEWQHEVWTHLRRNFDGLVPRIRRIGRICVGREELNRNFDGLARAHCFFRVAIVLREEFLMTWLQMAVFLGNRSRQSCSGAFTPSSLAQGIWPTRWFLDPAWWGVLDLPGGFWRRCG